MPTLPLKTEDWLAKPCNATFIPSEKIWTSNICRGSTVVDWIFIFLATHAEGDGRADGNVVGFGVLCTVVVVVAEVATVVVVDKETLVGDTDGDAVESVDGYNVGLLVGGFVSAPVVIGLLVGAGGRVLLVG
jgi:hypothetical protein